MRNINKLDARTKRIISNHKCTQIIGKKLKKDETFSREYI